MSSPPTSPRVIRISLRVDHEVVDALLRWRAAACAEVPVGDLVLEALQQFVSQMDPDDATKIAVRSQAFRLASARARALIGAALKAAGQVYAEESAMAEPPQ